MAYQIREEGLNGSVEVADGMIVRIQRKAVGKDDIQRIPLKEVTGVEVDRQTLKTDVVTIQVGTNAYTWKVQGAEDFANEVLAAIT